ncbi:hypothetical protein UUU_34070 [Klebsiella pneumoniae subsp. pneumoniae DSM 30104 = JCM 1662 = NBRC 14940]|nr:hypothetical protein UUU_34070 [Klebsiella pneumoniae subsp. pneumoniae DSM 30104 = JCM 1662 = NBRC 14940]
MTHHPSTAGQQKHRRLPWDRVNNGLHHQPEYSKGNFHDYFL